MMCPSNNSGTLKLRNWLRAGRLLRQHMNHGIAESRTMQNQHSSCLGLIKNSLSFDLDSLEQQFRTAVDRHNNHDKES